MIIFSYTRKEAIEDGVLIDVTEAAREVGFKHDTVVTANVWVQYVKVPDGVSWQDETGRLFDILNMLRWAIKSKEVTCELRFQLHVQNEENEPAELITLKAHCGPGDDAEPVITIMLPNED